MNKVILFSKKREVLGAELIVNGTFDADTNWTHRTVDSVISGGFVSWDGSQPQGNDIYQNVSGKVTNGLEYKVSIEVKNYVSGSVSFSYGGTIPTNYENANGVYIYDIVWGGNTFLYIQVSSDFKGSVDNVSLKQIL